MQRKVSIMKKRRDYKREYLLYHGKPEQIKRRMHRNAARRTLVRAGLVSKGDGKDVHHRDNNPANRGRKNLQVIDRSKNRSQK